MTTDNTSLTKTLSCLYKTISLIETEDACKDFFEDICSKKELISMAQRLDVAKRLLDGQSFNTISSQTGASTATISRVSHCLSNGSGGYKSALKLK